jgi:ADP-ribose pyrophosphatase YjhB (NUDIX family)
MRRRYPKHPLLGIGALIFPPEGPEQKNAAPKGAILMVERGRNPLKGYWSLPGGLVETGETLETAVKREVLEETGLRVEPLKMVELFERIMRDAEGRAEYHYVLVDYVCKVVGGKLRPGDDVSRTEWVERKDLPSLRITQGTLDVIERVYRARRKRT